MIARSDELAELSLVAVEHVDINIARDAIDTSR